MVQLIRRIIFALFFLLHYSLVYANSDRAITPVRWQQLTRDGAFGYVNEVEKFKQPQNIDSGFLQKIFRALFGFFNGSIGTALLWLLLLGGIIFIVWKLFLDKDSFMFSRSRKRMDGEDVGQEDEDISATNWEALLQQAKGNNDLRMAVRYSYMWLLQLLQQHELIQYRIDKTNYEYATELNDTVYKQPFKQLSRKYEYAWYGHFVISDAGYNEYADLFNNVKKQLGA